MGTGYGDRLARGGARAVFGSAGSRMSKEAWDAMFEFAPEGPAIDGEASEPQPTPAAEGPVSAARLEALAERFNRSKG
jgi:hypothetical protein